MQRHSKTISKKITSASSDGIRSKGEKWSQGEMETLVSLCVSHGRSGILSKETNKSTIAKKDTQWATIMDFFNSVSQCISWVENFMSEIFLFCSHRSYIHHEIKKHWSADINLS